MRQGFKGVYLMNAMSLMAATILVFMKICVNTSDKFSVLSHISFSIKF